MPRVFNQRDLISDKSKKRSHLTNEAFEGSGRI